MSRFYPRGAQNSPSMAGQTASESGKSIVSGLFFLSFAALSAGLGGLIGSVYLAAQPSPQPPATLSNSTKIQRAYEDRIAALRGQIDRLKSRQLLDQHLVSEKLDLLFDQQEQLRTTHQSVESVLSVAQETGLRISLSSLSSMSTDQALTPRIDDLAKAIDTTNMRPRPVPERVDEAKADKAARAPASAATSFQRASPLNSFAPLSGLLDAGREDPFAPLTGAPDITSPTTGSSQTGDELSFVEQPELTVGDAINGAFSVDHFASLSGELNTLYAAKLRVLDTVVAAAELEATTLRSVIDRLGVKLSADFDDALERAAGGPLVEIPRQTRETVSARLAKADRVFKELTGLRTMARNLPIASPVRQGVISSGYGRRIDPFLGRPALHTGVDFKAPRGTKVFAAGAGDVVFVGRKGGYGKLVEVAHGHGLVTRYAHLHRYHVSEGDVVRRGDYIGEIGSTGRSTGPHLHFETRRHDQPTNPALFLTAGTDLEGYL